MATDVEGVGIDDLLELVHSISSSFKDDSNSIPPHTPMQRPSRISMYLVAESSRLADKMCENILN